MIGVVADSSDLRIAEEFFELFKTPWEVASPGRKYSAIVSTDGWPGNMDAPVVVTYGGREYAEDRTAGLVPAAANGPIDIRWRDRGFPIYGRALTFPGSTHASDVACGGQAIHSRVQARRRVVHRIGYDLFGEVRHLLTRGQPAPRAESPTLDLHVALLRSLLLDSSVPFVEIPPRPDGHEFICCLTHDIDFCEIRRHRGDRTLAGFACRASIGTAVDLLRGRRTPAEAIRNLVALMSLPFVFLGLLPDFWRPFDDYAAVEQGPRSTFFVIPYAGKPGTGPDGVTNPRRAVRYAARDIRSDLAGAAGRGSEIAVHGIDAWRDAASGRRERAEIASASGTDAAGVRMHWLYFDADSPRQLEAAGFEYDSTYGYNEAVGYRAGTSQVFRLLGTRNLLELPLSIMDSALFFAERMALSNEDALRICRRIVANARHFGGTVVINFHDRSLAPERLWTRAYRQLLGEVEKGNAAWFCTASEAVAWFRWRRSIRFVSDGVSDEVTMTAAVPPASLPGAVVRIHRAGQSAGSVEERRFEAAEMMTVEA
jgi:hypothetical protein